MSIYPTNYSITEMDDQELKDLITCKYVEFNALKQELNKLAEEASSRTNGYRNLLNSVITSIMVNEYVA